MRYGNASLLVDRSDIKECILTFIDYMGQKSKNNIDYIIENIQTDDITLYASEKGFYDRCPMQFNMHVILKQIVEESDD